MQQKIKERNNWMLDTIKNIEPGSKSLKTISFFSRLSPEAKKLLEELIEEKNTRDPEKLVCAKSNGVINFNFNKFKAPLDFASDNYHKGKTSLKDAINSKLKC